MKNLLYIGNKLVSETRNVTTIETLGNLFINEGYNVNFASAKRNKTLRLLHMLYTVWLHRKSTDYVLIDTYSTLNFYYAFFVSQLCRFYKLKYIPILHGGNLPMRLEKNPGLSSLIFKNAYKSVSPSHFILESFKKKGFHNVEFIPNTFEINKYPFKERILDKPRLLWVRAFKEIYNPLMAIKVVKQLNREGIEATLCMVGPDADGSILFARSLARELELDVTFTGKLSKEKWIDLSKEHNIFINTAYFDNMPVSLIEAMALGLPLITTNVGGIPSLVHHNQEGLLVNPNMVTEMVEAVKELIKNPKKAWSMAEQARINAEQFDWIFVKEKWKKVLK